MYSLVTKLFCITMMCCQTFKLFTSAKNGGPRIRTDIPVRGFDVLGRIYKVRFLPMEAMMTIRQTMRKVSQNLPTSVACCDAFSSHRSTKCQDIQIQN